MVSYGCNAANAIMNTWSRSVVSSADFASAARRIEWAKVLHSKQKDPSFDSQVSIRAVTRWKHDSEGYLDN
jgi:hypothetical protein